MTPEQNFRSTAPKYMRQLMADFDLTRVDAAAVFGNAGHESRGFTALQEIRPTVPGSRGGWGWFQWTGPRRRTFEAYCKRTRKNPASNDANYAWLFLELKGKEAGAIPKLKAAKGLANKTVAFERAFERAGIKHDDRRIKWAEIALDAYEHWTEANPDTVVPSPEPDRGWLADLITRIFNALFGRRAT